MVRVKYLKNNLFFQVREFCGWPGKFRMDLESPGKVRDFENKWLWQAGSLQKIYLFCSKGEGCTGTFS